MDVRIVGVPMIDGDPVQLARRGRRVAFYGSNLLVQELLIAKRDLKLSRVLKRLSGYEVLMLVGDAPGRRMRVSELSSATLLSVSGISRLVDRLARDGLVVKEACEEDGRGARVALTPAGRGRLRAARASHLADVRRRFLSRFGDGELEAMAGFWRSLGAEGPGAG